MLAFSRDAYVILAETHSSAVAAAAPAPCESPLDEILLLKHNAQKCFSLRRARFGSNEGVQKCDLLFDFCFTRRRPQVNSDDVYGGSLK